VSLDRFIRWPLGPAPTREQILPLLEDYFGGAAAIRDGGDRYYIDLPGVGGSALRHAVPERASCLMLEKRWIEVWRGSDSVDVITRGADEYTNGLAARLAETIAQAWGGEENDPEQPLTAEMADLLRDPARLEVIAGHGHRAIDGARAVLAHLRRLHEPQSEQGRAAPLPPPGLGAVPVVVVGHGGEGQPYHHEAEVADREFAERTTRPVDHPHDVGLPLFGGAAAVAGED
jgi:hypothetical protein